MLFKHLRWKVFIFLERSTVSLEEWRLRSSLVVSGPVFNGQLDIGSSKIRPSHWLERPDTNYPITQHHSAMSQRMKVLPVKVKVKFTLEQALETQRGSRGIALLTLSLRR